MCNPKVYLSIFLPLFARAAYFWDGGGVLVRVCSVEVVSRSCSAVFCICRVIGGIDVVV